jgi:hypothetical protein
MELAAERYKALAAQFATFVLIVRICGMIHLVFNYFNLVMITVNVLSGPNSVFSFILS